MTKADKQRGVTFYEIFRTGTPHKRTYQIDKIVCETVIDSYWVELKGSKECYCNCQGFRRQKFPKMEHKHVRLAIDFHDAGEPEGARYTIKGAGISAEIIRV